MPLTSAEHAEVLRLTKARRNAHARARRWCRRTGARVERHPYPWGVLWIVKLTGFHPAADRDFVEAVAHLARTVEHFRRTGAAKGPTGGKLDRLWAVLGAGDGD